MPCLILRCNASIDTLEQRLRERQQQGTDPSDADISVARHQLEQLEALTEDEQLCSMDVATDAADSLTHLVSQLRERF